MSKLRRFGRQFLWISNKDCGGDDLTENGLRKMPSL